MSIAVRRMNEVSMYIRRTSAIPETIAENRNTTGINGVDHQGFALIDPKIKPTYPCRRKAEGIPMTVMK